MLSKRYESTKVDRRTWLKMWKLISTFGQTGYLVIRKTRKSGNIDQEQMCPDKRIFTVLVFNDSLYKTFSRTNCANKVM